MPKTIEPQVSSLKFTSEELEAMINAWHNYHVSLKKHIKKSSKERRGRKQ